MTIKLIKFKNWLLKKNLQMTLMSLILLVFLTLIIIGILLVIQIVIIITDIINKIIRIGNKNLENIIKM